MKTQLLVHVKVLNFFRAKAKVTNFEIRCLLFICGFLRCLGTAETLTLFLDTQHHILHLWTNSVCQISLKC